MIPKNVRLDFVGPVLGVTVYYGRHETKFCAWAYKPVSFYVESNTPRRAKAKLLTELGKIVGTQPRFSIGQLSFAPKARMLLDYYTSGAIKALGEEA